MRTSALIVFKVVAVLLFAIRPAAAGETLRVRADFWMPFNGGEGADPGYVTEVLQAIFPPKGIAVDYQNMSWEKSLAACRAGEIDAAPCASVKEGRGCVFPEEQIADIQYGVFVLKNSGWKLAGPESFRGQRIGGVAGYNYWEVLDRFLAANPTALVGLAADNPCPDGVKKLLNGEIDLLPESPQVFFWTVKKLGLDPAQFRMACRLAGDPVFVVFRPDDKGKAWAKILDEGIRELRANGRFAQILAKYGVQDWK